ncbi:unnamed protein product [Protopolystoma xenopodis]|uniref:Uncharacterized protein n=1 Tax=Protopolystoma xenopodis TaxID=117903 RepID=A0A3S4ZB85_9PLAT|nr:unnamed protein product [Protopolystoma xenopodis]
MPAMLLIGFCSTSVIVNIVLPIPFLQNGRKIRQSSSSHKLSYENNRKLPCSIVQIHSRSPQPKFCPKEVGASGHAKPNCYELRRASSQGTQRQVDRRKDNHSERLANIKSHDASKSRKVTDACSEIIRQNISDVGEQEPGMLRLHECVTDPNHVPQRRNVCIRPVTEVSQKQNFSFLTKQYKSTPNIAKQSSRDSSQDSLRDQALLTMMSRSIDRVAITTMYNTNRSVPVRDKS